MGLGLSQHLVAIVRAALKLDPTTPDAPPQIDRLAHYRAEIKAVTTDGAFVDVAPEDQRIDGQQHVPLRTGSPGSIVIPRPGSIVWLGWDGGDPSKPHAIPTYEQAGPDAVKLVWASDKLYLGGGTGTQPAMMGTDTDALLGQILLWLSTHTHQALTPGPTSPATQPAPTKGNLLATHTEVK